MSDWASLGNRMAGKWQLPLLVVSLILLAGSIYRIRPTPTRFPPAKAVEHLETLVAGGLYEQAIDFGDPLLGRMESAKADRAPVHLLLARARYGEARQKRIHTANAGRQIVDHFGQVTPPVVAAAIPEPASVMLLLLGLGSLLSRRRRW